MPSPLTESLTEKSAPQYSSQLAFFLAIPIGVLGGLMGLGGAEFRLPVLAGVLNYPVRQAVPLNLLVSLITIIAALIIRGNTLSFMSVIPFLPAVLSLIAGAVVTAFLGATLAGKLSNQQLERSILVLLVLIGVALIVEGLLLQQFPALLPSALQWWIVAGIGFGLGIGLISSLLGVAGGEVIIPTLIFAFGADIKTAGTASLLISLPTVLVGVLRYSSQRAFTNRHAIRTTIVPMGVGSIIGAVLGGLWAGLVPAAILKVLLGVILNLSAFKVFYKTRSQTQHHR